MEKTSGETKGKALLITLIILLLCSNGIFLYLYLEKKKAEKQLTEQLGKLSGNLVTTETERNSLDSLLQQTEEQLSVFRGKNETLDSMMQVKDAELQAQANKIRALLKDNKITAQELLNVRDEMDALRYYTRKYSQQIDSLAQANVELANDLRETKTNLNQAKEKITDLTLKNNEKEKQISLASRLRAESIAITGLQKRTSGRERETMRASRVDQLRIKFFLGDNPTASGGDKEVYMKIVSPEGVTISTSTTGGGQFDYMGEKSLYTQKQRINFKNDQPTLTYHYARGNTEWEKGTYKCELYCDGFMIGNKNFTLD